LVRYSRGLDWAAIFTDFHQSGLTQVQFCELRRIPLHSFRYWLYRLRPGLPPPRPRSASGSTAATRDSTSAQNFMPAFLPVHVLHQPLVSTMDHHASPSPTPLELVLSDRCQVRVPTGFDPATLHQLLDVLEQRS
jgi:hypothetical protein